MNKAVITLYWIMSQVAWIKADTKAILAIHESVITNNARLSVTHNDFNTWTLNIRNVRREDRGQYMCQVNTDPMKMQARIHYINQNMNWFWFIQNINGKTVILFPDGYLGSSYSSWYYIRRNLRRHDGTRRWFC